MNVLEYAQGIAPWAKKVIELAQAVLFNLNRGRRLGAGAQ